jgi:hypothetical protein
VLYSQLVLESYEVCSLHVYVLLLVLHSYFLSSLIPPHKRVSSEVLA